MSCFFRFIQKFNFRKQVYKFFELDNFVQIFKIMHSKFYLSIIFILLIAGCRNPVKDAGNENIFTIATLKGPSSMGMIRMIDSISKADNPNVRIDILNEPIQVRKRMLDGTADFSILPTTMASILFNKGLDYRLIAIPVWGTLYLFGKDTSITSWEHLRGKKVNVMARGMTPDVLFRFLLQKNGINPETDLTLDYSFPTHIDLANAVAAGQADFGVISEPLVSLVMNKNKDIQPIFDLNSEWTKQMGIPIAQTAFLAKNNIIQEKPQLVEQLILAYEKSSRWVNQNPDSAATLIVKYNILPNYEVAVNAIPRSNLDFVRSRKIQSQIEEYLRVFYNMNVDIVGGKMPDENFIY